MGRLPLGDILPVHERDDHGAIVRRPRKPRQPLAYNEDAYDRWFENLTPAAHAQLTAIKRLYRATSARWLAAARLLGPRRNVPVLPSQRRARPAPPKRTAPSPKTLYVYVDPAERTPLLRRGRMCGFHVCNRRRDKTKLLTFFKSDLPNRRYVAVPIELTCAAYRHRPVTTKTKRRR